MPHRPTLALTAALLAVTASACRSSGDDDDTKDTPTTVGDPQIAEADTEDHATIPTAEDLAEVDDNDPEAVAAGWGCAFWSHARGETPAQLAERLAPLSTPELQTGLAQLRLTGLDRLTIEVVPGLTDNGPGGTWTVRCHTITTGADAAPAGPPTPVTIQVALTKTGDGWLADSATQPDSGLTIP